MKILYYIYQICMALPILLVLTIPVSYTHLVVLNLWKAYPKFRKECKRSTWIYRCLLYTSRCV